jgi:hypothetical protein
MCMGRYLKNGHDFHVPVKSLLEGKGSPFKK